MNTVEYELKRQQDERRNMLKRIFLYIAIICAFVIVAFFAFNQFKTYSKARLSLREAKNIKMTLEIADLEYYSVGLNIYDETADGNLRQGAKEYLNRMQDDLEGIVRLTGYDSTKRKITGLEYETADYIVRYTSTDDGENWQVCQIKELLSY